MIASATFALNCPPFFPLPPFTDTSLAIFAPLLSATFSFAPKFKPAVTLADTAFIWHTSYDEGLKISYLISFYNLIHYLFAKEHPRILNLQQHNRPYFHHLFLLFQLNIFQDIFLLSDQLIQVLCLQLPTMIDYSFFHLSRFNFLDNNKVNYFA